MSKTNNKFRIIDASTNPNVDSSIWLNCGVESLIIDSERGGIYKGNSTTLPTEIISKKNIEIVKISYEELYNLKENANLKPGIFYRITDYECTTTQADSRSANHPFDIIVQALDEKTLSENASAIQREGDEYFANSDLNAWKLKYDIDNDASRFAWAKEQIIEQPAKWSCDWGVLEERYDNSASTNYTLQTIDGSQWYLYRPAQPNGHLEDMVFCRYESKQIVNIENGETELYFVTDVNPFTEGASPMRVIHKETGIEADIWDPDFDIGIDDTEGDNNYYTYFFSDYGTIYMKCNGETIQINEKTYYKWVPYADNYSIIDRYVLFKNPFVLIEGDKTYYDGSIDNLYYALSTPVNDITRVYYVTDGNHIYEHENTCYGEWDEGYYTIDYVTYEAYIAPQERGKGVIYRMIDEHNNNCPFDFKNMQFLHNGEWYYTFSYIGEDATLGDYCANNHLAIVQNHSRQNTVVTTTMPMLVFNLINQTYYKNLNGILNNDVQSPIAKGFIQGTRISGNKWLPTGGGLYSYFKTFYIYSNGSVYGNIFRGFANEFVVGSVDKPLSIFNDNTMTLSVFNNFNITIDCLVFVGNIYHVLIRRITGNIGKKIVGGHIRHCYFDDYGQTDASYSSVVLSFVANFTMTNSYIRLFNTLTINYENTTSSTTPLRFLNIDARGWDSGTSITIPPTFPVNADYELKVAKNSIGEIKMWCDADLIK